MNNNRSNFDALVDFMNYTPIVQDALDRAATLDGYNRASDMGMVANLFEEKCSAIRKILPLFKGETE